MKPELRSLRARIAANARWSKDDRKAYGARLRELRRQKIEKQVDPDGVLPPEEREARVRSVISEQATRAAYAKALKAAAHKAAGSSVAADEPACETTTNTPIRTGKGPR